MRCLRATRRRPDNFAQMITPRTEHALVSATSILTCMEFSARSVRRSLDSYGRDEPISPANIGDCDGRAMVVADFS
jgi:hypothetical protein